MVRTIAWEALHNDGIQKKNLNSTKANATEGADPCWEYIRLVFVVRVGSQRTTASAALLFPRKPVAEIIILRFRIVERILTFIEIAQVSHHLTHHQD